MRTLLRFGWARDEAPACVVGTVGRRRVLPQHGARAGGAVVPVGEGRRRPTAWPGRCCAPAAATPAVQVMPAHGLCLEEIVYPEGEDALRRP